MKLSKKKIAFAAVLAALAGVVAMFALGNRQNIEDVSTTAVDAFRLTRQNLTDNINISGSIEGDSHTIVNSQNTKCTELNVSVGDYVNAGDILFEFDDTGLTIELDRIMKEYEAECDKAENTHQINLRNLNAAQDEKTELLAQEQRKIDAAVAARDEAKARYTQLESECSELQVRIDTLYAAINPLQTQSAATVNQESAILGSKTETILQNTDVSAEGLDAVNLEYQKALNAYETAYTEMKTLELQLSEYENAVTLAKDSYENVKRNCESLIQNAQDMIDAEKYAVFTIDQSDVDAIKAQIADCVVTAPISGIITELNVSEGLVPNSEKLITIADTSAYHVSASLSETNIYKVEEGMQAIIKTVATADKEYSGQITRVSGVPEQSNNAEGKNYAVEIVFTGEEQPENVLLGMTATADIILSETCDVFAVPYDAVIEENEQNYIMVAEPSGDTYKSKKVKVETGVMTNYFVEVVGTELQEDMIVIYAPEEVEEGMTISVNLE